MAGAWLESMVGKHGWKAWLESIIGEHDWRAWLESLVLTPRVVAYLSVLDMLGGEVRMTGILSIADSNGIRHL
jgi:hypothetical protein